MTEDAMSSTSGTDWERVDALTDDDIDTSEAPPLSDEFFERAQLRMPRPSLTVVVPIDPDTFEWFQGQGDAAEDEMAAALRIYAEAHQRYKTRKAA